MNDNIDISGVETAEGGPELPAHLLAKLRVSIPGYELTDRIDSGGQATVYRARELTSGLTVAVKVLNGGVNADEGSRERLLREAAALRALNHPNIVCVIESGRTPVGLDYLVLNYVEGRRLDALWTDRKFSAAVAPEPPARLRLFKRICDIVQAAHLKGITHRDLSPSNILISADAEPHVLDFGLASTAFNDVLSPRGRQVSMTGQFIGKLQYAAPEQARGGGRDAVDIRTDVYALGVILYQILTDGAFPYEVVGNLVDILNNIIHTRPLSPSAVLAAKQLAASDRRPLRAGPPLVNETIEAVVFKALEKRPEDRYQSAAELAADIDLYLAGRPTVASLTARREVPAATGRTRNRRRSIWTAAVTVAVITGVVMSWHAMPVRVGREQTGVAPATTPAPSTSPVVSTRATAAPPVAVGAAAPAPAVPDRPAWMIPGLASAEFDGWTVVGKGTLTRRGDDLILTPTDGRFGIVSGKSDFAAYRLRVQVAATELTTAWIGVRVSERNEKWEGLTCQLGDRAGAIAAGAGAANFTGRPGGMRAMHTPYGEFARMEFKVGGKTMWITIDGTSTAGVTRNVPDEGRIGFFVNSGSLIVRSASFELQ
jgi:serine/threonine protein kinase